MTSRASFDATTRSDFRGHAEPIRRTVTMPQEQTPSADLPATDRLTMAA
ncbi:hypothetical protein I6B53_08080 [Schaalia sp. 19OD2882]|nr:hypothetical protein [Schaalia sp. 19OD2882]QWW19079.1 hypothetical protein I6B53_08080 [Schaalia sp. 19OD2882]